MIEIKSNNSMKIHHAFSGVEDFLEHNQGPITEGLECAHNCHLKDKPDWSGKDSWDQLIHKGQHGDPALAKKVASMAADLKENLPGQAGKLEFQYRFAEAGDEPDVGRFLSGEPECMLEPYEEISATGSQFVKIAFNCSASCAVGKKDLEKAGMACACLVDAIEAAGLRAEVVLTWAWSIDQHTNKNGFASAEIPLKAPEDQLDLDRLAFWICSPGVLRKLSFKWTDRLPKKLREKLGGGYGYPKNYPMPDADVTFSAKQSWDLEKTEKEIEKILEKFTTQN